jgi:anaerobic selenocysteine-containing dehydrogenase
VAGYSGTPLLKKLGIKEGDRVLVKNAPATMPEELAAVVTVRAARDVDVALLFATSVREFNAGFAALSNAVKPDGMIWAAWPKKASGVRTDLTENVIRDTALKTPFVDVKVCAIDETWSGLKLVVRKELRASFASARS